MTGTTLRAVAFKLHGLIEIGFSCQGVGDSVDIGTQVYGDDVGALLRECDGMTATLAARGAGDDGHGVVEFTHGYTDAVRCPVTITRLPDKSGEPARRPR